MKLAEALQERADLNRQIQQLRGRLSNNAVAQEGETPAEDPAELIEQLERCVCRLEALTAAINKTNCQTLCPGQPEETLTALIARKDCLTLKLGVYRGFLEEASRLAHRASRTEIKIHSAVDVRALQKRVDGMAKALRLLDNRIQQTNWNTDLLEE